MSTAKTKALVFLLVVVACLAALLAGHGIWTPAARVQDPVEGCGVPKNLWSLVLRPLETRRLLAYVEEQLAAEQRRHTASLTVVDITVGAILTVVMFMVVVTSWLVLARPSNDKAGEKTNDGGKNEDKTFPDSQPEGEENEDHNSPEVKTEGKGNEDNSCPEVKTEGKGNEDNPSPDAQPEVEDTEDNTSTNTRQSEGKPSKAEPLPQRERRQRRRRTAIPEPQVQESQQKREHQQEPLPESKLKMELRQKPVPEPSQERQAGPAPEEPEEPVSSWAAAVKKPAKPTQRPAQQPGPKPGKQPPHQQARKPAQLPGRKPAQRPAAPRRPAVPYYKEERVTLTLTVPPPRRQHVIGPGGDTVRRLRQQYPAVRVEVPPQKDATSDKVTIDGPKSCVNAAVQVITQRLDEAEAIERRRRNTARAVVHVSPELRRHVVGRGGEELAWLAKKYPDVKVLVPRPSNTTSRQVTVKGPPSQVAAVEAYLLELVAAAHQLREATHSRHQQHRRA